MAKVKISGIVDSENIEDFLKKAIPYGFDADLVIERLSKRKDYDKMSMFIKAAHGLRI